MREEFPIYASGEKIGEVYLEKETVETLKVFLAEKNALVRLQPEAAYLPRQGVVELQAFNLEIISTEGY